MSNPYGPPPPPQESRYDWLPAEPSLAPTPYPPSRRWRQWTQRPVLIVGAAALLVGIAMGASVAGGDVDEAVTATELRFTDRLEREAALAEEAAEEASATEAELVAAEEELAALQDEVAGLEDEIASQAEAAALVAADLDARAADLAAREAAVAAQEAAAALPAPVVEAAPAPSSSAYYDNCSAARAAGAAPLYVGDPGYRSGLDRDNDGVACE